MRTRASLSFDKARGAAIVDLNADGMLDLVIVDRVANVRVYRNVGAGTAAAPQQMGNWIALRLAQDGRQPRRDRLVAGGQDGRRHAAARADHRWRARQRRAADRSTSAWATPRPRRSASTWPDGTQGDWQTVTSNQTYQITPGAAPAASRSVTADAGDGSSRLGRPALIWHRRSRTGHRARASTRQGWRACARAWPRSSSIESLVYADREHSANIVVADRLRPALRGGAAGRWP